MNFIFCLSVQMHIKGYGEHGHAKLLKRSTALSVTFGLCIKTNLNIHHEEGEQENKREKWEKGELPSVVHGCFFFFHVKAAFSAAPLPLSYLHLITVASLLSLCLYVSHQLFLSLCYLVATLPHSTGYSKRLPCRFIAHTRTHAHKRAHKEARACMCVCLRSCEHLKTIVFT